MPFRMLKSVRKTWVDCTGRLATDLGSQHSAFAAIAGPQEAWRDYLRSSDVPSRSKQIVSSNSGRPQASRALLDPVQAKFR